FGSGAYGATGTPISSRFLINFLSDCLFDAKGFGSGAYGGTGTPISSRFLINFLSDCLFDDKGFGSGAYGATGTQISFSFLLVCWSFLNFLSFSIVIFLILKYKIN
ncbi:MAG: hypothetical protein ABI851_13215, partial [Saprospiraceae bacterium]